MEFKRWKNIGEILPEYVETFCNLYNEREEILKEIEEFSRKTKTPILLPSSAALLKLITELKRPEKVLEIGTGIGYSTLTIFFSSPNSQITTADTNEERLKVAKEFFKRAGAPIKTFLKDGLELMRELLTEGEKFDLIFVDSVKSEYPFFHYKFQSLLRPGGVAVFDNVLFRGYIAGREHERRYKRGVELLKKFLEQVKDYPNSESSLIPIGDGLLIFKLGI